MKLNVGILGIGNAGGQIAYLAKKSADIPAIAPCQPRTYHADRSVTYLDFPNIEQRLSYDKNLDQNDTAQEHMQFVPLGELDNIASDAAKFPLGVPSNTNFQASNTALDKSHALA